MEDVGCHEIRTKHLKLCKFTKDDVEEVYNNYGSDDSLTKYISWVPFNTMEKCEKFIKYHLKKYEENPLFFSWKIVYDDKIVGSIALYNVDTRSESGELGYIMGSEWQNKGLMTETVDSVLEYAFNQAGFHRIYASCHEDNMASKRVLEKLGMTYEGKLRDGQKNLDGSYSNLDLYAILHEEYEAQQ